MSATTNTKPKRPILDLQVNLPCSAFLKYADHFVHAEYGEKVKGVLVIGPEQATDAYLAGEYTHFFFPGADAQLLALGAIQELAEREGKRQFKVLGNPILTLKATEVKGEDGKRRRHTVLLVNGVQSGATGRTQTANSTSAAAPVEARRGDEPPEPAGNGARLPEPTPPPATDAEAEPRRKAMAAFDGIGEEYEVALRLGQRAFRHAGLPVAPEALHAAAATILIQAERRGYRGYRGMAKAFAEYLERTDPRGTREAAIEGGATERAMAKTPERETAPRKDPYVKPWQAGSTIDNQLDGFDKVPAGLEEEDLGDSDLPF